jgi:hypothetical protein
MQITLTRFWFEFEANNEDWRSRTGCGVTAYNYQDAIRLLTKYLFEDAPLPTIIKVIEDIDVSTLDANHILVNLGAPPNLRGIWWPVGRTPAK